MPLLSYSAITNYPFQPFTKIYSSDINSMFSTIQTLLNTTKLDMTNIQSQVLTRTGTGSVLVPGTANAVVINDSNGNLTDEAQLAMSRGGLGANLTPSGVADASKVIAVNAAGNGFQLQSVPSTPGGNIFNFYRFA
jgi:hypothetical protein